MAKIQRMYQNSLGPSRSPEFSVRIPIDNATIEHAFNAHDFPDLGKVTDSILGAAARDYIHDSLKPTHSLPSRQPIEHTRTFPEHLVVYKRHVKVPGLEFSYSDGEDVIEATKQALLDRESNELLISGYLSLIEQNASIPYLGLAIKDLLEDIEFGTYGPSAVVNALEGALRGIPIDDILQLPEQEFITYVSKTSHNNISLYSHLEFLLPNHTASYVESAAEHLGSVRDVIKSNSNTFSRSIFWLAQYFTLQSTLQNISPSDQQYELNINKGMVLLGEDVEEIASRSSDSLRRAKEAMEKLDFPKSDVFPIGELKLEMRV